MGACSANANNPESQEFDSSPIELKDGIDADDYQTGGLIQTQNLSQLPGDYKNAFIHDPVEHAQPITNVVIMYNPVSGNGDGKLLVDKVIMPSFESCDLKTHIIESEGPKFMTNYLIESKSILLELDVSAFIVVGGDGTYHEFCNGYIAGCWKEQDVPVMFLSGGTGNSLCLDIGQDSEEAVKEVIDEFCRRIQSKESVTVQWMDCIELTSVGSKYMNERVENIEIKEDDSMLNEEQKAGNIVTKANNHLVYCHSQTYWGVPAACGKTAESLRFLGGSRYDVAALYQIMKQDARHVKLTMYFDESDTPFELDIDISSLTVMKNKYFGKGLMITPLAKLDNGLLDVSLLPNVGRKHTLGLFKLVPEGAHILNTDPVKGPFYWRVRKITIEPEEGCHDLIGVDGEEGPDTPLCIEVLPKAIPIIYFV